MITQDLVKKLFHYKDGQLIRLVALSIKSKVGDIVGFLNDNGYLMVGIGYRSYRIHRLIWLYHYGYLPKYLDHINGIRDDNRIENLRECTISQNGCNSKKRSDCSSKHKGVSWCKERRLWEAYIDINKKRTRLGRFWDKETAAQVVRIERVKLHGEFANDGGVL